MAMEAQVDDRRRRGTFSKDDVMHGVGAARRAMHALIGRALA